MEFFLFMKSIGIRVGFGPFLIKTIKKMPLGRYTQKLNKTETKTFTGVTGILRLIEFAMERAVL